MQTKYLLLFISSVLGLYSCSEKKDVNKQVTSEPTQAQYKLTAVKTGGLQKILKLPGQLAAYEEASIVPKINGYVKSVFVDIGTHVNKGQLLMVIEAPELEQQEAQAKENYAQALASFNLNKENYIRLCTAAKTAGAISPMSLETAKAKMESDSILGNSIKASWQAQQIMQGYLRVTAPFSGVITERNIHPGSLVSAEMKDAKPMLEIKQTAKLRLQVDIPENMTTGLKPGDDVTFYLGAFPGKKMNAKVARKANDVDMQYRSERVEMDVQNANEELAPGMYADVIFNAKGNSDAMIVPRSAVVTSTERKYVVAVRNGKAKIIDVVTGNDTASSVEVVGNFTDTDKVIVNANDEIKDGEPIKL